MSTVSLPAATLARARELFLVYSKKAAFTIDEYADAGAVYKRVTAAFETAQKEGSADVDEVDVKYLVSAVNICSTRVPTEVQNYKPIAELLDTLTSSLTEDEELEEKAAVTEL